jgi:hypothetical protein
MTHIRSLYLFVLAFFSFPAAAEQQQQVPSFFNYSVMAAFIFLIIPLFITK